MVSVAFAQFAEPEEPYVLIVDSDIIFRRPYVPHELKVRPGDFSRHPALCRYELHAPHLT